MDKKEKILIIGAGQMGSGIAQTVVENGYFAQIEDISASYVENSIQAIFLRWENAVKKGKKKQEEINKYKQQIKIFTKKEYSGFKFIIEAVSEDEKLKTEIFKKIAKTASSNTILGSNTSSISITKLGNASGIPKRVIGIHFMNPVPVMRLVEVIEGEKTSKETTQKTLEFVEDIKKTPAKSKDKPGFISNKILMPMINEAIETLESKTGTKEDIDTVMELGMRHPLGPLKLADLIGLDTCLAIMNVLHKGFGEPKYKPNPLLVKKVKEKKLGIKTGEGFYKYN